LFVRGILLHKACEMRRILVLVVFIILAVALHMGDIPVTGKHAAMQRQSQYAIYLSPGPREGTLWGGYHVTVTSFSDHHAPGKSEKSEARKAWANVHGSKKPFYFNKKHRKKDYWAHNLSEGYKNYGICFKSGELDRMTQELHNRGFDNQKQVENVKWGNNCRWHVSLYCKTSQAAIEKFEKELKNRPWKLYEVRYPGTDPSADWTKIS